MLVNGRVVTSAVLQNIGQVQLSRGVTEKQNTGKDDSLSRAEDVLKYAASLPNASSTTWCSLGLALAFQGKEQAAVSAWTRTDARRCHLSEWGDIAFGERAINEAEKWYERYRLARPDSAEPLYYLGLVAETRGNRDEALAFYTDARKMADAHLIESSLIFHIVTLQIAHFDIDLAHALALLDEALRVDQYVQESEKTDTYFYYGDLLLQEGQVVEAVALFDQALQLQPNHYRAHIKLGEIAWLKQDDISLAERYFSDAIDLQPQNVWAYKRLARMYADSGQTSRALEIYENVLQIDPNDQTSIQFIDRSQSETVP